MKKLQFLTDFLYKNIKLKNKLVIKPKVGDNIFIKFFYVQGIKILRFHSKTFFGRCIAHKRKNSNTELLILRNVYNRDPIELSFFLKSPFVIKILRKNKNHQNNFNKQKLYFLRFKKLAQSKVKR
jgi:ribosomal protein L19